jgi:hypothetical protein
MMAPPTPLRPVANSMVAAGWLTAAGVIIAVGAVVALRRPEAAAALAFRVDTPPVWRGPGSVASERGCWPPSGG